jgi:hypothetical protein
MSQNNRFVPNLLKVKQKNLNSTFGNSKKLYENNTLEIFNKKKSIENIRQSSNFLNYSYIQKPGNLENPHSGPIFNQSQIKHKTDSMPMIAEFPSTPADYSIPSQFNSSIQQDLLHSQFRSRENPMFAHRDSGISGSLYPGNRLKPESKHSLLNKRDSHYENSIFMNSGKLDHERSSNLSHLDLKSPFEKPLLYSQKINFDILNPPQYKRLSPIRDQMKPIYTHTTTANKKFNNLGGNTEELKEIQNDFKSDKISSESSKNSPNPKYNGNVDIHHINLGTSNCYGNDTSLGNFHKLNWNEYNFEMNPSPQKTKKVNPVNFNAFNVNKKFNDK